MVKHGDLVRLEHVMTRRNIHSHQQPAPMSKKQFQVNIPNSVTQVVEFLLCGVKIRFLAKIEHTPSKLLYFVKNT